MLTAKGILGKDQFKVENGPILFLDTHYRRWQISYCWLIKLGDKYHVIKNFPLINPQEYDESEES